MINNFHTKLIIITFFVCSSFVMGQLKIGYILSERVRTEYEEFQEAESQLQLEYRKVQTEFDQMVMKMDSLKQDYEVKRLMALDKGESIRREIEQMEQQIGSYQAEKVGPQGELMRKQAQMEYEKPTVIIGNTIMAQGCATMEGDHNTHGAPLPPDEISATKQKLGLDPNSFFQLSDDVLNDFRSSYNYSREEVKAWNFNLNKRMQDSSFKNNWKMAINDELPNIKWPIFESNQDVATRKVWGSVIETLAPLKTTLVGGSADLEPSNVTAGFAEMVSDFNKNNYSGRNFAYGVREFPMGAINNGIAQHGGLKVFGATFFVFSDYERPAVRLRALQNLPVISEYTHDSIYVGEDGPTHQPIEHIMSCRLIPNLLVLRPADANEAVIASKIAFEEKNRPSLILLTRQKLPVFDRSIYPSAESIYKGGYVIQECEKDADITIFCSGSEVWVGLEVREILSQYQIRVVNLACWELFEEQSKDYKKSVIGSSSALKISIEAGVTIGWQKYTGNNGLNFGIDRFGESAPGKEVAEALGLTPPKIAKSIEKHLHTS